ncbi:MAG TPA: hypothetical protein VFL94_08430 [Actinomycetales bacterium]|nr:hypothetical protein [Actinomycetales bacterium]
MDPSSLIFLAIIAIWAAYLVGHWIRRRDQLATARSIDRFSEAMRVLERRAPTRPVTAARPTARSYVVAPVRVPPVTSGTRTASSASSAPTRHGDAPAAGLAARLPAAGAAAAASASASGARLAERRARPGITRDAARRRARLVLALVSLTVLAWCLVAATGLVWWPAAVVTALLGAVLVRMRRTARSARTSSGARRGLASRVPAPARRPRHHQDVRSVLAQVQAARRSHDTGAVPASSVVGRAVITVDAGTQAALRASTEAPVEIGQSHGSSDEWQPVPVPPPTYTLKPKARPARRQAERPGQVDDAAAEQGAGGGPGGGTMAAGPGADVPAPVAADEPPQFDLDEILERRIAANG